MSINVSNSRDSYAFIVWHIVFFIYSSCKYLKKSSNERKKNCCTFIASIISFYFFFFFMNILVSVKSIGDLRFKMDAILLIFFISILNCTPSFSHVSIFFPLFYRTFLFHSNFLLIFHFRLWVKNLTILWFCTLIHFTVSNQIDRRRIMKLGWCL